MVPKKSLIILAVIEGLVMTSAVLRVALFGLDFNQKPQLIWFVGTLMLSGTGLAQYVVRAAALQSRAAAGESVDEERKQIFLVSIAILVAAGLLSAAGPEAVQRLLG